MVKKSSSLSNFSFKGKVANDSKKRQSSGKSYGHLKLPRGVSVFSPEPGTKNVLMDIIPYVVTDPKHPLRNPESGFAVEGSLCYLRPYKLHRNIGVANESVICLHSVGKKCPICTKREELRNNDGDEDEIKSLNASDRALYAVIPLKNKKYEEKVHIFDMSQFNFQNLLDEELEENDEHEIFPNLVGGETLKVRWGSKTIGKGKPFPEASKIEFVEREEDYDEAILEDVPSLDDMLNILSFKELSAKFLETDDEEDGGDLDEEDDDDEEEAPKRSKKTLKKKPVKDEDEEDEDDEEEDDEEEDDEPVKKKKVIASKKKKPVEEDEDDEEDDDEEDDDEEDDDEDEEPVRKSSKKKLTRR